MNRHTSTLCLVVLAAGLVGAAGDQAQAGAQLTDPSMSTCTTLNCSTFAIPGSYQHEGSSRSNPFVVQVYSAGGECLRIDVVTSCTLGGANDLAAILVSPDGFVWGNDDRADDDCRPLILADTTAGVAGWYTLHVSHWDGAGGGVNSFAAYYGRYNVGNSVNCPFTAAANSPLPPQEADAAIEKKSLFQQE